MLMQMKKRMALFLTAALLLIGIPINMQPRAAAAPKFTKTYPSLYDNDADQGVYNIQVSNVKKGYITKWRITGKGKNDVAFDTPRIVAKSKTVSNTLTVNGEDNIAFAAGSAVRIKVNVYTAKRKLITKLAFDATLKRNAGSISIDTSRVGDVEQLQTGRSYAFHADMSPANATSDIGWEVKDSSGKDCSAEITAAGIWTPTKEGDYSITAYATNPETGQRLCTKTIQASVKCHMESVSLTAVNGIHITFSEEASSRYQDSDFSIRSGEASVLIKKVKYSEDGKTAYITTSSNFVNGRTYTILCAGMSKSFTAEIGKPARLSVTTDTVQVNKLTPIKYTLLDANGIDVTSLATGSFYYSSQIQNGYVDQQTGRVKMTVIGSTGTVTMNYISDDGSILTDVKSVICIAQKADVAETTRFTLTGDTQTPSFREEDVRSVAIGDTMYAHFRGLDEDEAEISYDEITYESSDLSKLVITPDGKMIPMKVGTVLVTVNAKQGGSSVTYSYSVTIKDKRYLAAIQIQESSITVSNTAASEYKKEVAVKAVDQYGENYTLSTETGSVTPLSTTRFTLPSYDAANNVLIIRAPSAPVGTYGFTLTLTADGRTASQTFVVNVVAPSNNGAVTYQVEASQTNMDLSVDASVTGNRTIDVRLAEYHDNVFYGYKSFSSATITKNGTYYDAGFIPVSYSGVIPIQGSNLLMLTPLSLSPATGTSNLRTLHKAEAGTYTIALTYQDTSYSYQTVYLNITLTDSQKLPDHNVYRLVPDVTVTNALELAKSCINIPTGTITECTVRGTTINGSSVQLLSGQSVYIETISVTSVTTIASGELVNIVYTIPVNTTLTNK